jgi:hypothetical protein
MKKITLLLASIIVMNFVNAQRRPNTTTRRIDDTQEKTNTQEESNDKAENRFFWGGGLVASFGGVNFGDNSGFNNQGNQLILGIIPEIGYSVAKPLDVGLTFNLIYYSSTFNAGGQRVRLNAFNYGIGAFTRLHITEGFFATAVVEQNFFDYTQKLPDNPNVAPLKDKVSTLNALVGVGWGTRNIGDGGFYSSILLDINRDKNSPYVIYNGTSIQAFPVFRAGFIKYFRKKNR